MNQPSNLSDLRHIVKFFVNKDMRDYAQQISLFKIQKTDYDFIESSSIDVMLNVRVTCLLGNIFSKQFFLIFALKRS